MSIWKKLFGGGSKPPITKSIACPACGHSNTLPNETPAFGSAVICSQCKASLIPVRNPREQRYILPRSVALFLGYRGCSLIHADCPWCQKVNYSVVVPERGHDVSFYWNRKQENPKAAFVVNVKCPQCEKPYVIEWDEDPR